MSSTSGASPRRQPPPLQMSAFQHGQWRFEVAKGHIMTKEQEETFMTSLSPLPSLPDMVFSLNHLLLSHSQWGDVIQFRALEALQRVNATEDLVHVAMADSWKEARKDSPYINKVVKPFDWTYTPTDYRGSILNEGVAVTPTEEKIDYEKLKVKEQILFYDDVILFEDELDDNGCTKLSAKIRVMPSGFFLLLRFYLRVDQTLIRVQDSRIHHEFSRDYMLREYTERESKMGDLRVPMALLTDQNQIVDHLALKRTVMEKIEMPKAAA